MTDRIELLRKPAVCPSCGRKTVARIHYGLPNFTPELERALDEGKIVLGGCCIMPDSATWVCTSCDQEIHREVPARLPD